MRGSIEGQFLFAAEGQRGFFRFTKTISLLLLLKPVVKVSVSVAYILYMHNYTQQLKFFCSEGQRGFFAEGLQKNPRGQRG